MSTIHKPVLLEEVIKFLQPKANQNFIDGTIGGGGHTQRILMETAPQGKVLGLDWDSGAIKITKEKLAEYKDRLILVNESYTKIKDVVYEKKFNTISGAVLDLGLSSDQLQASGRGFSFQSNEPLDMRFSLDNELTAEEIVNEWPMEKLKKIFRENSDERYAEPLARAICQERQNCKIEKTLELVSVIVRASARFKKSKIHPATKIFQALRMEVNNELENVKNGVEDLIEILPAGARLAVITFHSAEDRIVKTIFKRESKQCLCPPELPVCRCEHKAQVKLITTKPIIPSDQEIAENFRCRSAKLRVIEKT